MKQEVKIIDSRAKELETFKEQNFYFETNDEISSNRSNDSDSDSGVARSLDDNSEIENPPCECESNDERFRKIKSGAFEETKVKRLIGLLFDPENRPEGFEEWSSERQREFTNGKIGELQGLLPETLTETLHAIYRPGDCGRSSTELPEWIDMAKYRRGQKFAMDNLFSVAFAKVLGLIMVFAFKEGVRPLVVSKGSHTPYLSFKRYLSTVSRIISWYQGDLWAKGTAAYKDMQVVRSMHLALRRKLCSSSNDEIDEMASLDDFSCPARDLMLKDFRAAIPEQAESRCIFQTMDDHPFRPKGMNQADMAITQFAFVSLVIIAPEELGIHNATEEDLDAFSHVWRVFGYFLGIEDEYNFCRGDFAEVKKRTLDVIDHWVKPSFREITPAWEHMLRCLAEGVQYYFAGVSFEMGVLHLADILAIEMPRLHASIDYGTWIMLRMMKLFLRYTCRLRGVMKILNAWLAYCMECARNYGPDVHEELERKSARTMELWKVPIST